MGRIQTSKSIYRLLRIGVYKATGAGITLHESPLGQDCLYMKQMTPYTISVGSDRLSGGKSISIYQYVGH